MEGGLIVESIKSCPDGLAETLHRPWQNHETYDDTPNFCRSATSTEIPTTATPGTANTSQHVQYRLLRRRLEASFRPQKVHDSAVIRVAMHF